MSVDKNMLLAKGVLTPILPLRDIVVFPHMIVPLFVGRDKSVKALEKVVDEEKEILLVTQKDGGLEDPGVRDLYTIGTLGNVLQLLKLPDGTVKVLVEGTRRAQILRFVESKGYYEAYIEPLPEGKAKSKSATALMRTALSSFERYIKFNSKISPDVISSISRIEDSNKLADTIASHLSLKIPQKQEILEISDISRRLEAVCNLMEGEISVLQTERRIRGRVKRQMEKTQREYYLNEQMKAIQKELSEGEEGVSEMDDLESKIKSLKLSKEAQEKAKSELKKLGMMNAMSSEATVVRNYLDWLLGIPWKERTKVKNDLEKALDVLDKDHYGLEKVKERILEYLAVQSRLGKVKGPILCLVGPPGVGKTSLGESMARATGRKFVRVALGGVRDESEIRGHRRTYIGSMPGKIIQGMRKAGKSNPLFLLDEIDKLGSDWRGDPSSALLEVLDPEQNSHFNDHYLEVDYDLSDVMFITTANSAQGIPFPLLDRMEVIQLSGYTEDEKLEIAKRHLIPKQRSLNGLKASEWSTDEETLREIIRRYVRESGVRNFERQISKIIRKTLKIILTEKKKKIKVTKKNLSDFLGVPRYRYGEAELKDLIGITTGLAWTEVGGEILSIEAVTLPGKGKVLITGKLGDVMQESIQAASSYIRSRSKEFGILPSIFEKVDIHIHVPEGATPKDGPSAGVGMVTSMVSVLTGIPVRKDVAMTGEISLRGRVLAIGGLKEKLLAAHRGGLKTVLIPEDNEKDLIEIPDTVKKGLNIIVVSNVADVLKNALTKPLKPITWTEEPPVSSSKQSRNPNEIVTH